MYTRMTIYIFIIFLLLLRQQWLEEAVKSRDKEDQTIVDIFLKHNNRLLGFKHGYLCFIYHHVYIFYSTKLPFRLIWIYFEKICI